MNQTPLATSAATFLPYRHIRSLGEFAGPDRFREPERHGLNSMSSSATNCERTSRLMGRHGAGSVSAIDGIADTVASKRCLIRLWSNTSRLDDATPRFECHGANA